MRIVVGGEIVGRIAGDDRGLAYGDGVFETVRIHAGRAVWWDAHWRRLALGAQRLAIPLPDEIALRRDVDAQSATIDDGVLKLLLTRGAGGRGYAPPAEPRPMLVISTHPLPAPMPADGIALRWCETRLAIQPALAGIKHCNRLEQVLARAEWNRPDGADLDADEGLMCDSEGFVVCATAANLFALRGGRWRTPPVDRCGIAGVCRGWLLANGDTLAQPVLAQSALEQRLTVAEVETADALFLCNAVRGILPVARLGARRWHDHAATRALMARLAAVEPAFAPR